MRELRLERDTFGPWMTTVEELGESMQIGFGRVSDDSPGVVEWSWLPHAEYDGIGGLGHLLRCRGQLGLDPLASSAGRDYPGKLGLLRAASRALLHASRQREGSEGGFLEASRRGSGAAREIAWRLLTAQQTARVVRAANAQSVSVNSYLLWGLGSAVAPFVEPAASPCRWLVPVNLRGGLRVPRDTANHASFIRVKLSPSAGPQAVDAQVRERLARAEHWCRWAAFHYLSALPRRLRKRFVEADLRGGAVTLGAFSNLGEWPASAGASWLFSPPVPKERPVSAGCVTSGGRMGLTLFVHPSYLDAAVLAEGILERWVTAVDACDADRPALARPAPHNKRLQAS